jgi:hypothetical protein
MLPGKPHDGAQIPIYPLGLAPPEGGKAMDGECVSGQGLGKNETPPGNNQNNQVRPWKKRTVTFFLQVLIFWLVPKVW